jgi:hypothetical protein
MSFRTLAALLLLPWTGDTVSAREPEAAAQTRVIEYSRQADVIYGRKFGVALTMEILAPAKANGLGVVWIVSSGGVSAREHASARFRAPHPAFHRTRVHGVRGGAR